jgi:Tfp pilus assembly protein PilP
MRLMTSLLIVAMSASVAAQSPSTVQGVRDRLSGNQAPPTAQPTPQPSTLPYKAPTAKPSLSTPQQSAAQPTATGAKPGTVVPATQTSAPAVALRPALVAPKTRKPAAKIMTAKSSKKRTASVAKAPKAPQPAEEQSVADAAKENKVKGVVAGRRDPFVSPVVERTATGAPAGCTSGKKCLVADQLSLRGIIKSNGANIAVVVTGENRAYFMRVNDPVYNGVVVKINETSVTFREQTKDVLGKPTTREVVKKINSPA